jgi:uncharacterized protein
MRLSPNEQHLITNIVQRSCKAHALYLFGSRTDDTRKGGDIDLFLELNEAITLKQQLQLQYQLTSACDTHLDLLVKNPTSQDTPFFNIGRQGIRLL